MLLLLAITLLLGTFEGIYGRVRYSGDAISYLNMVRAIHVGDWKLAFSSYWGLGYPLLISFVTPLFPATPAGEWVAVHVLNLVILVATFCSFYLLVGTAMRLVGSDTILADTRKHIFLLLGSFAIFLSIELTMDNISRIGPDLLVSGLVFAACAMLLKLADRPTTKGALTLGAILGLGFVVKAIFLPLTLVFAFTVFVALWKKRPRFRYLALVLAAAGVFAVPYVGGLSWAAGHFTYGDAGPLNYAWNVNKLEPGGLWQGQPPGYGTPIHPAKMVSESPHVYLFDGPFAVTFSPFFNPPYYYQGYRRFFSLKAQIHEFAGNVFRLVKVLRFQFVLYAVILAWILARVASSKSEPRSKPALKLWPLLFISLAGTGTYLLVFLEARYVASFLAMTLLVLLLSVAKQDTSNSRRPVLIALLLLCCIGTLVANAHDSDRDLFGHFRRHELFSDDPQWKAAIYLRQNGLHPGDKVAIMSDLVSATRSTWSYIDDVQIVGILGGSLLETQTLDFDTFWHSSAETQRLTLDNFHHTGARAVVALTKPDGIDAPGWNAIPGTNYWVYKF
jgi:hypothetical protein